MIREPVCAALFAKLNALKPSLVKTCSRKLLHWNDVPAENQPAIFLAQAGQEAHHQAKGLPYMWDMTFKVYVYVHVQDDEEPAPVLNPILDAIEAALTPFPGLQQTLGGLCDVCYIDGNIETFEGTLGNQEVAIIPIKILVR